MALNLYLGSSGTGKSHDLYEMIVREAAKDFDRSFLLIVPEQFTLQTQRDMIRLSPNGGIMNIDVLSFPRMSHRIFEELGVQTPVTLEDTGKTMIVKKVALDHAGELGIYAGKVHSRGFISGMKSIISEFYQYGIGDGEFRRMTELAEDNTQLRSKLKDIGVIRQGFRDFINGRFIMNEELLEIFIREAPRSKLLKGAHVCFDGFTGFTVMQLRVIECLCELGCDISVTVTIDPKDADKLPDEEDLFCLSEKTIEKLTRIADETGTDVIRKVIAPETAPRFRDSAALAGLERNLFRKRTAKSADSEGITLVTCENPAAEVRSAICEIRRLVAKEGCRYSDIGVIVGDMSAFGPIADREFMQAGIPYFLDRKKSILGAAPVEFVRAVNEIAYRDFTVESVFRFLKTGLTGIESSDIDLLESYCTARPVRGKSGWDREWTAKYKTRYEIDLERINEVRSHVAKLLVPVCGKLKKTDATVSERIAALKELLEECGVYERLHGKEESSRTAASFEERIEGLEAGQLPDRINEVFERIGLLLGDDRIDLKEFSDILDTGFSEAKMALIPQGSDQVVIGDMERTRFNEIRALLVLGCNDGMIPSGSGDAGLLSESDRSLFAKSDIELSPGARESAYLNEFYIYLNFTRPTRYLWLSAHRMTPDRKPGRPSYIFGKILKLFDGLSVRTLHSDDGELLIGSDGGKRALAQILRKGRPEGLSAYEKQLLYELLTRDRELFLKLADAAFSKRLPERITPENARKLYGEVLTGSVTRLEKYASCAFAHFISYGLCLEEQPEYKVGAVELGNIYHRALEYYCLKLKEKEIRWHDTDAETRENLEKEAALAAFAEYDDVLSDSKRNEYYKTRVERVLSRTVDTLEKQIRAGSFEPEYFEQSFTHAVDFMRLKGKIDRMDICEKDGKKLLRVIDYKSGKKEFSLEKLFYGLQIQLAVYMIEGTREVAEKSGDVEFAGMYYYHIDDPIVSADDAKDDYSGEIGSKLKMSGPSLDTGEALRAQDAGLADENGELVKGAGSDVINVGIKKDGQFSSTAKLFNKEQFDTIGKFTEKSMNERADAILNGDVKTDPYYLKEEEQACKYCAFGGICGFDRSLGDEYRKLRGISSEDEAWERINGAMSSST